MWPFAIVPVVLVGSISEDFSSCPKWLVCDVPCFFWLVCDVPCFLYISGLVHTNYEECDLISVDVKMVIDVSRLSSGSHSSTICEALYLPS